MQGAGILWIPKTPEIWMAFCARSCPGLRFKNSLVKNSQSQESSASIDEYIAGFPPEVQVLLNRMRATIQKAAPRAEETIKYRIPTFVQDENLVHFAAFKNHIGFYPTPSAIEAFKSELAPFESAKGSVKFPLEKAIPWGLITRMVTFRVRQVLDGVRPGKNSAKSPRR